MPKKKQLYFRNLKNEAFCISENFKACQKAKDFDKFHNEKINLILQNLIFTSLFDHGSLLSVTSTKRL